MHPGAFLLACVLALPLYGLLLLAAAEKRRLWAQLPYVFGISLLLALIRLDNFFALSAAVAVYCAATWVLVFLLREDSGHQRQVH